MLLYLCYFIYFIYANLSMLLDGIALAGFAMPTRASVSDSALSLTMFLDYRMPMPLRASTFNSIYTPMNGEALEGFAPKGT